MTLDPKKSIRDSGLFASGSFCHGHLRSLLLFPKGTASTFILSPSRDTDPTKIKANALNQELSPPPTSQRTEGNPLPHPCSSASTSCHPSMLLSPSLHCLLRSTPLPQPPRFHRADTFTHTPPSFSSEESLVNKLCPQLQTKILVLFPPGFWKTNPYY